MSDFIWPSDQARAENDELNRVCNELEDVMDQAKSDEQMAHIYRVENIKLTGERDALAASVVRLMGALELARDRIALLAEIATDRGAAVYAALDMWPEEMAEILAESPTTSLDRLKAELQADAVERAMKMETHIDRLMYVKELHRQAEGDK